jgi:cellulose synthase/poly-beta-1,6-N-acetylglucosamine synthase-like glycosyltransferase
VPTPRVSIVIPAFHSDDTIADCLESLRAQTLADFEIIVVNSSPESRTRRIVEDRFPEVGFEQAPGRLLPHAARNAGVKHTRGEILVFTDPDCVARRDWLQCLVRAVNDGHAVVCGAIEPRDRGWFARGVHLCKYSFRLSGLPGGPSSVAGTANACYTREVWNAVGPFDGDRYAGDALFSWRAAGRGWQPWFEPRAIVEHRFTGSLASLWTERLERGHDYGDARVTHEQWSRVRAAGYLAALPLHLGIVIARTAQDAFASRWGLHCISTIPVQLVGQAAWIAGEARAYRRWLSAPASAQGAA